jgi:outer membrane protein assembly factor BamB
MVAVVAAIPVTAAPVHPAAVSPHAIGTPTQQWQQVYNDGPNTIFDSSPVVAALSGGPAVVVGDTAGNVYATNLASGSQLWDFQTPGAAPVESSPSAAITSASSSLDSIFVGSGDAQQPTIGGYQAITPSGTSQWLTQESNPSTDTAFPHNGVQASLAVGNLQGGTDVTAGSLGQNQLALNANNGAVLSGFPWLQLDSEYSTPALADLYGNGQTEIIEGGASTANSTPIYGQTYQNGGLLRVVAPTGSAGGEPNAVECQYQSSQEIDSSPAVGEFLAGSQVGIVSGTGSYYAGAADTDKEIALTSHCGLAWSDALDGLTSGSPALADVLGNGQLQVIQGTGVGGSSSTTGTSGTVYALNGANGAIDWQTNVGAAVTGGVVTADLGSGYQDVIATTTDGVYILDGKTGAVIDTMLPGEGFQNSALVTDDSDGLIGLTFAGYMGTKSYLTHYEVPGSNGSLATEAGAWPEFHHDPQLTGDSGTAINIQVPCNAPAGGPQGYDLSASDGGVFNYGNLPFCGSTGAITLNKPVVGIADTHDGGGYWEVASDGGIFAFGDAKFYGSTGAIALNKPIVGMAATPDGGGYWLVASDGGIFSFGDAGFYGSTGAIALNKPIVGMASTPDGGGYWLVASDGGIFSFGDAKFYGSTGAMTLNQPIAGMAASHDGGGYWLVASDGGIFSFGDAKFYGSTGAMHLNQPVVGMEATPDGGGYRFVAADGGIFDFGDATFYGSTGAIHLNKPVVGMAGF